MLIRREDFNTNIEDLSIGSKKKVWFTCDWCGIGVLQEYRTYVKTKTDLCRKCRNKETATNPNTKIKHSMNSNIRWKDPVYREKVSKSLSIACKKAWDRDDGSRRKNMSINNPMRIKEIREKVAYSESISDKEIEKFLLDTFNYKFLYKELGHRGGAIIHYICDKGHRSVKRLDSFRRRLRCDKCFFSTSQGEEELRAFIVEMVGADNCEFNNKNFIYPYEIDILIKNISTSIEYNGVYYHSEAKGKDKNFHLNKTILCKDKGYRLIHIFEDEWIHKKHIVKNRLKHILGFDSEFIYARNCIVKEIDTKIAKNFCDNYHIQGYGKSKIKLGLFDVDNNLVSVMTFSKPNISKGGNPSDNKKWELNRFCSSVNVVGGMSKLLSYFKKNFEWNMIFSYVDRRWNTGKSYEMIGFEFEYFTKPNYWYTKTIKNLPVRYHRFNFRRSKLKGKGTEKEIMERNGWNRIWDCGSMKFSLKKI